MIEYSLIIGGPRLRVCTREVQGCEEPPHGLANGGVILPEWALKHPAATNPNEDVT